MIVTCERCASQFQLDEAKIPSNGVRLRCSRCEHAFFVESPAQPETDHAADLVRDVLASEGPEPDSDTYEPNQPSGGELPTELSDAIAVDAAEDEWGFNDDDASIANLADDGDAALADDLTAAREAVDDLLGGIPNLDVLPLGAEATDPESSLVLDLEDVFSLDTEALGTTDGSVEGEIGSIDDAEPVLVAPLGEDDHETPESVVSPEDEPEWKPEPADGGDEFDDPASWDIFDSEPAEVAGAGAFESQAPTKSPISDSATPIGEPRVALSGVAAPVESKLRERLVGIVGWMLVAPLLAISLVGGLLNPNLQLDSALASSTASGFELRRVSARWIDNATVGQLYVISGQLRRAQGPTGSNVSPIAIRLLDADGQPLELPAIAVGPKISEPLLRESSPADMVEFQNRRAPRFAAMAGSWVAFEAVVPVVPGMAERFEFSSLEPDAGY